MAPPLSQTVRPERVSVAAILLLFLVAASIKAMTAGLNHDEQQFVAPASLWASHGLLPYRDFPIFHMPNLVFVFGAAMKLTTWDFLAARLVNGLFAWGIVAMVFLHARRQLAGVHWGARLLLAGGCALLLMTSQLHVTTAGKTWNHDAAVFLVVSAYLLVLRGTDSRLLFFLSGLCMGAGIGTRLTVAPAAAPLCLAALLLSGATWRSRLALGLSCGGGMFVGLLPSICLAAMAPGPFFFDNLALPRVRLLDPADERARKTMSAWRKLRFFVKEIGRSNVPLFLAFFALGLPAIVRGMRFGGRAAFAPALLGAGLVFAFIGCAVPTRYQYQHYYAIAPFLALAVAHGLAVPWRRQAVIRSAFMLLALVSTGIALSRSEGPCEWFSPERWTTVKIHRAALELASPVASGKVLTLGPIHALEGGRDIYPELSPGPFGWRLAHLIPKETREEAGIPAPEDIEEWLESGPPAGILLGAEGREDEGALRDYAKKHGYEKAARNRDLTIWVRKDAGGE